MARSTEFFFEYQDKLNDALVKGKLKDILELWLTFIEKGNMKVESKVNDLDDIFDWS